MSTTSEKGFELKDEKVVVDKLNRAYKSILQGLRTSLLAAKAYGEALLSAQEEANFNDTELYAWVREKTDCKLGDTTLSGYKRLAENWSDLETLLGEESLQSKTLVEALTLCKKHKRKSSTSAPKNLPSANPSNSSPLENENQSPLSHSTDSPPARATSPRQDTDEGAAEMAQNPVIALTKIIGVLKDVVSEPFKDDQKQKIADLIKEALRLITDLQKKLA